MADMSPLPPPFLKWPGGKRWLISGEFAPLLPAVPSGRYIEPFLGGGSVYFHLRPPRALLADVNADLIGAYQAIKTDWRGVTRLLAAHQRDHGRRHYYATRSRVPDDPAERAAWFIYLNRTCFNGIYRVNLRGVFNVPKGTKTAVVLPTDNFQSVAKLLAGAELVPSDFEASIDRAGCGDLVFADPPYTVRHNHNGFIKYNEQLFSWGDQVRLARALGRARDRGADIVATNADHPSVRALYTRFGFGFCKVERYSAIAAAAGSRRKFSELIITARSSKVATSGGRNARS